MTKKLLCLLKATLVLSVFSLCLVNCGGKDEPDPGPNGGGNTTEIKVTLPSSVDVVKGEDCKIEGENTLQTSDLVYLIEGGTITSCAVTEADAAHFAFRLPADFKGGNYRFDVKRGDRRVQFGTITINMVERKIEILPGTTIYGVVESAEGPIAGVVVSDGVETVQTDDNGVYQLKSEKESGYVFISVPGGYECALDGVFPDHYRTLVSAKDVPENQSFTLKKVDQSNYKVLFLGDMHLADRAKGGTASNMDNTQFKGVAKDINNYVQSNGGSKIYAITLGDMTWDLYWYDRNFDLSDYKEFFNEQVKGLPVYHTIGNHDNDMNAIGQFKAKNPFAVTIAPPYYSFNIGDVHYVVLDNIDCSKYVGGGDSNRDNQVAGKIYSPQFSWLAKDLSYVDKSTPVIITMHVPVYSDSKPGEFSARTYSPEVLAAVEGYNVHFVTGHTHRNYNALPGNKGVGNVYEHNVGAICSDWWWSGAVTPGCLMAPDGTPAGYAVWDITGKDFKYAYKCAGKDENFQFRSYDLNEISFSSSDVEGLNSTMAAIFAAKIADYTGQKKNEVLLNVWNYNTRWTITVTTADGKALDVRHVSAYDPLHIAANVLKRWKGSPTSEPIGSTTKDHHFFKVTAPDADTDLIITVKDEFGRTYTENMQRPKAFGTDAYKIEIK